jgi:hypothetical protein
MVFTRFSNLGEIESFLILLYGAACGEECKGQEGLEAIGTLVTYWIIHHGDTEPRRRPTMETKNREKRRPNFGLELKIVNSVLT